MSSYVPKCAKDTSDPYFHCYQQNSFTLPLFCWLLSLAGHITSLNINNLTHACIFQALSCWLRLPVKRTNFRCALKHFLPQSGSKRLFHNTSGGTFRIMIAYQESIIASFEDSRMHLFILLQAPLLSMLFTCHGSHIYLLFSHLFVSYLEFCTKFKKKRPQL